LRQFSILVQGLRLLYHIQREAHRQHHVTPFYIPPGITPYMRRYTPLYRRFPYFVQDFTASRRQPVLYYPYQKQPPVRYRLAK
jgi:hypothetical protein